jgi:hypothetical protein
MIVLSSPSVIISMAVSGIVLTSVGIHPSVLRGNKQRSNLCAIPEKFTDFCVF